MVRLRCAAQGFGGDSLETRANGVGLGLWLGLWPAGPGGFSGEKPKYVGAAGADAAVVLLPLDFRAFGLGRPACDTATLETWAASLVLATSKRAPLTPRFLKRGKHRLQPADFETRRNKLQRQGD